MGSSSALKHRLDAGAVLRRASSIPGCKSVPIPNSPLICSFLVGLDQASRESRDPENLARISVFTDTGTISIGRVLQGNIRQVFRRNVTSLDTVEEILRDPPQLARIDDKMVSSKHPPRSPMAQLELVDVGYTILTGEREKLSQHVSALEQLQRDRKANQEAKAAATAAALSSPAVATTHKTPTKDPASIGARNTPASSGRQGASEQQQEPQQNPMASPSHTEASNNSTGLSGMEFQFSLPPDAMKDVDRCLTDIHSMGKLVRKVATNGRGTVFLYGNGGVAYTPQIPKALYHRLSQLRHSSYEHRPAYVSLGSRDRYYCSFHDGSYAFKGPKGLDRELKKAKKQPVSVAFGSTYDTFSVVFADGSWKCGGRAVPAEFESKLGKRRDVHTANLGPEGEWFLKLNNKKMWWGGIHSELEQAIEDLMDSGHQLHFLDFGDDGSDFVSYD